MTGQLWEATFLIYLVFRVEVTAWVGIYRLSTGVRETLAEILPTMFYHTFAKN